MSDDDDPVTRNILNLDPDGPATDGPALGERPAPAAFAVHREPDAVAQPLQELVVALERARADIGGLISRVDQLETTIRRVDRQTIMMAGMLGIILWTVKSIAARLPPAQALAGVVDGVAGV